MKHLLHGISLFVFFLSTACDRKEPSKMPISQKMKTYCVGRHLFDVPSEFRLIYPLSGVFRQASHNRKLSTIGIKIVAESLTPIEFAQGVEKRRIELIASRREKRNLLEAVISPDQNATLFRVSRIEDSYMSEAHLLKGAAYFTAEARSYSGLFEVAEADIFDFASKIALADNINFSQSGFCLGPLIVGGDYEAESVTTVFRSDQRPDVIISISIDSYMSRRPSHLTAACNRAEFTLRTSRRTQYSVAKRTARSCRNERSRVAWYGEAWGAQGQTTTWFRARN